MLEEFLTRFFQYAETYCKFTFQIDTCTYLVFCCVMIGLYKVIKSTLFFKEIHWHARCCTHIFTCRSLTYQTKVCIHDGDSSSLPYFLINKSHGISSVVQQVQVIVRYNVRSASNMGGLKFHQVDRGCFLLETKFLSNSDSQKMACAKSVYWNLI